MAQAVVARRLIDLTGRLAPIAIGAIFGFAAVAKATSLPEFAETTMDMDFLPVVLRRHLTLLVPLSELLCAFLLFLPSSRAIGLYAAMLLLVLFTAFLISQLMLANPADCHCFGEFTAFMDARTANRLGLVRNAALLGIGMWGLTYLRGRRPLESDARHGQLEFSVKRSRSDQAPSRSAFTLAELLVVIGIIGLLLAILLPALSRARDSARSLLCSSNQRQVTTAALAWAIEHHGYLPPDGEVWIREHASGHGSLPGAMYDSDRSKYLYWPDYQPDIRTSQSPPTRESPVPFSVAMLARITGSLEGPVEPARQWATLRFGDIDDVYRETSLFRCPNSGDWRHGPNPMIEGGTPTLTLYVGERAYYTPWWVTFDYATNVGLLGFHHQAKYQHRRYGGQLTRVSNSAAMVLMGDSGGPGMGLSWTPRLESESGHVTLHDAWAVTPEMTEMRGWEAPVNGQRHRGRLNVAFVDGHVEPVSVDAETLMKYDLLHER